MRTIIKLVAPLIVILISHSLVAAQDTFDEAIKAYRNKDYPTLLKNIARVEPATGNQNSLCVSVVNKIVAMAGIYYYYSSSRFANPRSRLSIA